MEVFVRTGGDGDEPAGETRTPIPVSTGGDADWPGEETRTTVLVWTGGEARVSIPASFGAERGV